MSNVILRLQRAGGSVRFALLWIINKPVAATSGLLLSDCVEPMDIEEFGAVSEAEGAHPMARSSLLE
jgi:hypothetical protein